MIVKKIITIVNNELILPNIIIIKIFSRKNIIIVIMNGINTRSLILNPQSGNVGIGTGQYLPTIHLAIKDNDSGLHSPADGQIAIYTNNTEKVRINGGGGVGIGTNNPQRKLHVYDSAGYPQIRFQGTGSWDLSAESGGFVFYHPYGGTYYKINNNHSISATSDDRLKVNEEYITNAVDTLMKLKPQTYNMVLNGTPIEKKTPGLIAQDVYYDCPELRFLVDVPDDAVPGDKPITPEDPTQDPDYSNWGSTYAGLNYSGFQAYLIKAIQEQQTTINELKARIEVLETS